MEKLFHGNENYEKGGGFGVYGNAVKFKQVSIAMDFQNPCSKDIQKMLKL